MYTRPEDQNKVPENKTEDKQTEEVSSADRTKSKASLSKYLQVEDCSLADAILNLDPSMPQDEMIEELTRVYDLPSNKGKGIGAKARTRDNEGCTPLMAIAKKNDSNILAAFKAFIENKKLKINALDFDVVDKDKRTALMHSVMAYPVNQDTLDFIVGNTENLLNAGLKDKAQKTAVQYAIVNGDIDSFRKTCRMRTFSEPGLHYEYWDYCAEDWEAFAQCAPDRSVALFSAMIKIMPRFHEESRCLLAVKSTVAAAVRDPRAGDRAVGYLESVHTILDSGTPMSQYNAWLQTMFIAVGTAAEQYPAAKKILEYIDVRRLNGLPWSEEKQKWVVVNAFLNFDAQLLDKLKQGGINVARHLTDLALIVKLCEHPDFENKPATADKMLQHAPIKRVLRHLVEQQDPPHQTISTFIQLYKKSELLTQGYADLTIYIDYVSSKLLNKQVSPVAEDKAAPALQADLVNAAWAGDVLRAEAVIKKFQTQGKLSTILNQEHTNPITDEKMSPFFAALKGLQPYALLVVDLLLEQKEIDLGKKDSNKKTALVVAVESGSYPIVNVLVSAMKARGDIDNHEMTQAIHAAVSQGREDMVRRLAESASLKALEKAIEITAVSSTHPDLDKAIATHRILLEFYLKKLDTDPNDTRKFIQSVIHRAHRAKAPEQLVYLYIENTHQALQYRGKSGTFIVDLIAEYPKKSSQAEDYALLNKLLGYTTSDYQINRKLMVFLAKEAAAKPDIEMLYLLLLRAEKNSELYPTLITHHEAAIKLLQFVATKDQSVQSEKLVDFPFVAVFEAAKSSAKNLVEFIEAVYELHLPEAVRKSLSEIVLNPKLPGLEQDRYYATLKYYINPNKPNIFGDKGRTIARTHSDMLASLKKDTDSRNQVRVCVEHLPDCKEKDELKSELITLIRQHLFVQSFRLQNFFVAVLDTSIDLNQADQVFNQYKVLLNQLYLDAEGLGSSELSGGARNDYDSIKKSVQTFSDGLEQRLKSAAPSQMHVLEEKSVSSTADIAHAMQIPALALVQKSAVQKAEAKSEEAPVVDAQSAHPNVDLGDQPSVDIPDITVKEYNSL